MLAFAEARLAEDKHYADGLLFACKIPEKVPDFGSCGGPAAEAYWSRFGPRRMLAEVEAKQAILADVGKWKHYECEDSWYSCSQAAGEDDDEPGSGCGDEARAGQRCDCGLDAQAARILKPLVCAWDYHPDYRQHWRCVSRPTAR